MRKITWMLMLGLAGCGNTIELDSDEDYSPGDEESPGSPGEPSNDAGLEMYGIPCRFLTGEATLESWDADLTEDEYWRALFSFEFGTNDFDVVRNDADLLYASNMLVVNTVVDDESFIVDLGDLPLDAVPAEVDAADYPTGNWGDHDDLQAVVKHTYVVRTIDGNTRQWAAFKLTSVAPSDKITLTWVRSPSADSLEVPTACL
jgi:hypothetical protein